MTNNNSMLINITNPYGYVRENEPVKVELNFENYDIDVKGLTLFDEDGSDVWNQLFDTVLESENIKSTKIFFFTNFREGEFTKRFKLQLDENAKMSTDEKIEGIKEIQTSEEDGFVRLDTGYYILELCEGKADGTSGGKWGIRYFKNKKEDKNLIINNSNAIGGFYGPFFTPANGLINPPEHTKVKITPEVVGDLYHRYIFEGTIPDGLDINLRNKNFKITWEFYYNSPLFDRKYEIDDFHTLVDGTPVDNLITVGDEFEGGKGELIFDRFATYKSTNYRAGDPYAKVLYDNIYDILENADHSDNEKLRRYRESIGDELNDVSWDYFWRLFSVKEGVLTDDYIKEHIESILPIAHKAVYSDERFRNVIISNDGINIDEIEEQTIFPIKANKTCEWNTKTGYSMVWYTSNVVDRYQIVQRSDSGWVNWGTNGENEYPELKNGSEIRCSYGKFSNWEEIAEKMEYPVIGIQGSLL